jgi:ribose transport system substrate-binding protein
MSHEREIIMRIGKAAGFIVLGVAATLLCVSCGKPKDSGKMKVALVMKSLANEFFKTMENGAQDHANAHAGQYELLANGIKDEKDVVTQISIVEQMIARGVGAIVIAPADSKSLVPVCKKANDAGIIVVNIDNKFDSAVLQEKGINIPFVGPDNRKGARLAGDFLAKQLKKGDEVAIIEGAPNAYNAVQRKLGFEDAMNAVGAKIVASQSGQWIMDDAEKIAAGIITQFPEIRALLCANDNMALGALSAIKSAGKIKQIMVIGYDNISAAQERVRAGEILCTVDQHADKIAVYGIEYALEIKAKKSALADKESAVDLVTKDSLQ